MRCCRGSVRRAPWPGEGGRERRIAVAPCFGGGFFGCWRGWGGGWDLFVGWGVATFLPLAGFETRAGAVAATVAQW